MSNRWACYSAQTAHLLFLKKGGKWVGSYYLFSERYHLKDMTGSGPPKMDGIPSANQEATSPPNALTAAMSSPCCCSGFGGGGVRNTCTITSTLITTTSNYVVDGRH
jgi:hypothetical protein